MRKTKLSTNDIAVQKPIIDAIDYVGEPKNDAELVAELLEKKKSKKWKRKN